MASEASWQTSGAGQGGKPFAADEPMDQRTVECLLRRLVDRVEESERRYGEALDELHARLDQLSRTTEAARETSAPEADDTIERLHTEVSNLARRFERDTSLEDFERLGRALSGGLRHDLETAADPFEPSPFAQAAMAGKPPSHPAPALDYPEPSYAYEAPPVDHADLDRRLVEMAERLEQSIGAAMPTSAIAAVNTRLEEIGGQLSLCLGKAPTREALEHVERQISDMSQQLGRAEEQIGKISGVESHLLKLIERLDAKAQQAPADPAQFEEIAAKAAKEAARLVSGEARQTHDRLDAMHRDLNAMSSKSRESGDRLVATLEAVHESLKLLVQQVERGVPALGARPRGPFMEARSAAPQAPAPQPQAKPATSAPQQAQAPKTSPRLPTMYPEGVPAKASEAAETAIKERTLRDRLGAAIPDFQETETPPPFGRAKRSDPDEEAVDLDAAAPQRTRAGGLRLDMAGHGADAPDDLVAAARRAAQAAAARAEGRGGRRSAAHLAGSAPSADQAGRRKRSLLIISAAVLLMLSAALLYGRLSSKPEPEAPPASTEETTPPVGTSKDEPTGAIEGATAPAETAPAPLEPGPEADPSQSGSWAPLPDSGFSPNPSNDLGLDNGVGQDGGASPMDGAVGQKSTGFTDVAKSTRGLPAMPESELNPEPQLAALKPQGEATLPPGVIFSIEEPATTEAQAPTPMPPAAVGSQPLREAAAKGDATAQYAVALRYADSKGAARDLKAAAEWFERAARAGLAPAQYRLAAMYERGFGVDRSLDQARTWYAAAGKQGHVKAMHNLAVSVSGRDGGTPDYAMAAKWYGEAASYGLADSQFNLGILAEHGLGMTKNLPEAYKWFALAAIQGDAEAAKRREVIRVQLAPETLKAAEAAVKSWKAKEAPADINEVAENPAWNAKAEATESGSLVARAQSLLNKLGYDVGTPDGLVGSRTKTAIKLFQQRHGLEETGEVSIPLVTRLERLAS